MKSKSTTAVDLKFTASQDLTNGITNSFKTVISIPANADTKVIFGTVLNRLFEWQSVLKRVGSKSAFRCDVPINLTFQTDKDGWDTSVYEELQARLKMGNTAKGKRRFARTVIACLEFSFSNTAIVSIDELLSTLDNEVQAYQAHKAAVKALITDRVPQL